MTLNHKDLIPKLKALTHPQLESFEWALSFEEFLQLDFLTLTPEGFRGYEIKGENDVLTRLTAKTSKVKRTLTRWEKNEKGYYDNKVTETRTCEVRKQYGSQIEKYERLCRFCSVLTTEKHRSKVLETIPEYWGLYIGSEDGIECVREASENPNFKIRNLMNVLWLNELRDLSRHFFHGYSRWSSAEHAKKLATVPNINVWAYARIRDRFMLKEGRFDLPRHTVVKAPEKFREWNDLVANP
jgi:hypothetical protein